MLPLFALILACSDGSKEDSAAQIKDTAQNTGSDEIIMPAGDRVLLYYGHGGVTEQSTGKGNFDDFDEQFKSATGMNMDYRDSLPEDPSQYRMIGLIAPGVNGEKTFDEDDVALLQSAIDLGVRITIFADLENCQSASVSAMLDALDSTMDFSSFGTDPYRLLDVESLNSQQQITRGIDTIRLKEPCFVDAAGGEALLRDRDNNVLGAVQRIENKGEIVLIGDFEFFDNSGYLDFGDNFALATQIAQVYTDEVGDTAQ